VVLPVVLLVLLLNPPVTCCITAAGMQDDAESSEGHEAEPAGPSDHSLEDDSIQAFEGHAGAQLLLLLLLLQLLAVVVVHTSTHAHLRPQTLR
jgi:hypothetical protein